MENANFTELMLLLEKGNLYERALQIADQKYKIMIYKVDELRPLKVKQLYFTLRKKFYLNKDTANEETWFENELRIFIWLVIGYLCIHHKELLEMGQQDWLFFSPVFNFRPIEFLEYQARCLLRSGEKAPKWSKQQVQILRQIINSKTHHNKWNAIARELFIRSRKRYYRNSKQCRERWINHEDPIKKHCSWSLREDFKLFDCIRRNGKKWSAVVKALAHTRTEHMVKNRYNSLIANQMKLLPHKRNAELENIIIKRIEKELEMEKLYIVNNSQSFFSSKDFNSAEELSQLPENNQQQFFKIQVNRTKSQNEEEEASSTFFFAHKVNQCTNHCIEVEPSSQNAIIFSEENEAGNLYLLQENDQFLMKSSEFAFMKPPNLNYQLLMQSPLEKESLDKNDYFIDEEDESFL